jgi:hypothetical protein
MSLTNTVYEYQLPSPSEGLQFQLQMIGGGTQPTFTVRGNNVYMAYLVQGETPAAQTRTFQWTAVGNTWESVQPTQLVNYYAVLGLPPKTWVLLTVELL